MEMNASRIISAARAEADRMQAAVAGVDPDAKVTVSVPQFAKLAMVMHALCDLAPGTQGGASSREKESIMDESMLSRGLRSLAQIESDMRSAEAAFVDADDRFRQAERDRDAALSAIDQHQAEVDKVVAAMRRRSPEGSRWKRGDDDAPREEVLMLEREASSPPEAALIDEDEFVDEDELAEEADRRAEGGWS